MIQLTIHMVRDKLASSVEMQIKQAAYQEML